MVSLIQREFSDPSSNSTRGKLVTSPATTIFLDDHPSEPLRHSGPTTWFAASLNLQIVLAAQENKTMMAEC